MEPINTNLLPDYRLFKRLVIIAVAVLILCTTAFSAWKIITEYRLTIHAAELQTRGYASALKEHAERALNEADTTLLDIIEHIEEHGGINMKSSEYLHGILDIHIRISPQVASVFLVNRDGQLFEHTLDAPVKRVNVADRDYFIHHRDTPASKSSFLSKPLKSRISGKWRIILSRPIRGAAGEFAGVVAVALDPDYFHKFYASLDLGRNGKISMVRRDGVLLLSVPLKPSDYETGIKTSHLIRTRLPRSPRGTFHISEDRALPESNSRIISYDSLEYFPVVSLANMDEDEVLARWKKNTFIQGILIAAVSSALSLLALILLRKMKLVEAACQVQKEQQIKIAASAETWQSTFDAMEEAIWVMDTDRIVLRANKATERIFGRRLDQVIGNICCETSHGNKSPISNCPFQIMLDTGHRTSLQIMLGERWCYVSIDPVKNDAGEITGAVHIVSDVTERKLAEEALLAKQQKLAEMAVELSMTEERERRRIAAELHDHIGQNLLLGKMKLNSLVNALPAAIDIDRNELGEILLLQDQVIRSVRSLTQQLSPPILAGAGLESALEWLGKQMENDYALQVLFVDDRKPKPLTEDMRTIVYQACRELLINVAKHAGTKSARVAVYRERNRFCLTVEDQGTGFDFTVAANCGLHDIGFGLFNIRERIKHLEGEVILKSAPGQGTRVTLRVAIAEKMAEG